MLKKICTVSLAFIMLFSFAACDSSGNVDKLEATRESVDNWLLNVVYKSTEKFFETYGKKAQEQGCADYLNSANTYFSQLNLSNIGYTLEKSSETDVAGKYSYDATTYNQTYYIYFDGSSKNIALEIQGDNILTLLEVRELEDGSYAMQYYEKTDGLFNVSRLIFKGKNGRLSYSYDLKVRPTRIYNEQTLGDDYASSGDDLFVMTDGTLTYTTTRQKLGDANSVVDWIDNAVIASARQYYNDNLALAEEINQSDRFEEYMLRFSRRSISANIKTAMENGENTSGMFVYTSGDKNIIVSYDGSSKNVGVRCADGQDYYVFEAREIGKKKYSVHYYTTDGQGLYDAFRLVFRAEGNGTAGIFENLTSKPTLVYSKSSADIGPDWVKTGCNYYFTVTDGQMEFVDVAKQEQERIESEIAAAQALDSQAQ